MRPSIAEAVKAWIANDLPPAEKESMSQALVDALINRIEGDPEPVKPEPPKEEPKPFPPNEKPKPFPPKKEAKKTEPLRSINYFIKPKAKAAKPTVKKTKKRK
jgi:hypothetical protein